jgi:CheY-like chemotaxis protein
MPESSPRPSGLPHDVLVVENNMIIAMDVEESMLLLGVARVRLARNVADAMKAIDERMPDAALLDMELASGTSQPVATRLRQHGVRFAFMSGHDGNAVRDWGFDVAHLRKPFTTRELEGWLR